MCQLCSNNPRGSAGADGGGSLWSMFNNVLTFPARLQGYVLNAVVNTIDKVQCDRVLRETREIIEKEKRETKTAE